MGDELILLGSKPAPPSSAGSAAPLQSIQSAQQPSPGFRSVLNRQQLDSSRLQTLEPPVASQPASRPVAQANRGFQRPITPAPVSNPLPSHMQAQVRELMKKAPPVPDNVSSVEDLIRNHYQSAEPVEGPSQPTSQLATPASQTSVQNPVQQSVEQPQFANRLADPAARAQAMKEFPVAMQWTVDRTQTPQFRAVEGPAVISTSDPRMQAVDPVALPPEAQPVGADASERPSEWLPDTEGVSDSAGDFFQSLLSGLSLGFYRPEGEPEPTGIARVFDPFKKLLYDAPIRDLAMGMPVGMYKSASNAFDGNNDQRNSSRAEVASAEPAPSRRRSSGSKPWLNHTRA